MMYAGSKLRLIKEAQATKVCWKISNESLEFSPGTLVYLPHGMPTIGLGQSSQINNS